MIFGLFCCGFYFIFFLLKKGKERKKKRLFTTNKYFNGKKEKEIKKINYFLFLLLSFEKLMMINKISVELKVIKINKKIPEDYFLENYSLFMEIYNFFFKGEYDYLKREIKKKENKRNNFISFEILFYF